MMKRLFTLFVILIAFGGTLAQESPHVKMETPCETCHLTGSWNRVRFFHDKTNFPLLDRHKDVDCKSCHELEDFSKVSPDCIACHDDIHQAKLGSDCQRCHTERGWEVFDVEEIHETTQFPLMGAHSLVDCQSCHKNTMQGDFALFASDCIDCHQQNYLDIQNPNHVSNSFSTDCRECHEMNDWTPAFLPNHDIFFPVFSGEHDGVWNDCQDCHLNPSSFQDFSCINCHEHQQPEMDDKHSGMDGYSYDSNSCFSCHPTGEGGEFKDHDNRFFPIFTGDHAGEWDECATCHTNETNRQEFTCVVCHEHEQPEMDNKHSGITGYVFQSSDCLFCHPNGEKGEFREHDTQLFPIFTGDHAGEWDECATCHTNETNRQEFTCVVCHEHEQPEMDNKHSGITGYVFQSSDCLFCHPDGEKGDFREHDTQFFPIFTGDHAGEWDECATCHTNETNRQEFSCVVCHEHEQPEMDNKHSGITGYVFQSSDCLFCHPNGEKGEFREHDTEFFPIFTGDHAGEWDECATCHTNETNRQEFTCVVCHEHEQPEMDNKHSGITGYVFQSSDCLFCHPDGEKGEFREHDTEFFPIFTGDHAGEWDECATCHTNETNRQEFSCVVCHEHEQPEMDNKHSGITGYVFQSTDCLFCHPDGEKGDFREHDTQFFPIFTGDHAGEWDSCDICHNVPENREIFTCLDCHEHRQSKMDDKHLGEVNDYVYDSNACYECHPNGKEDDDD